MRNRAGQHHLSLTRSAPHGGRLSMRDAIWSFASMTAREDKRDRERRSTIRVGARVLEEVRLPARVERARRVRRRCVSRNMGAASV